MQQAQSRWLRSIGVFVCAAHSEELAAFDGKRTELASFLFSTFYADCPHFQQAHTSEMAEHSAGTIEVQTADRMEAHTADKMEAHTADTMQAVSAVDTVESAGDVVNDWAQDGVALRFLHNFALLLAIIYWSKLLAAMVDYVERKRGVFSTALHPFRTPSPHTFLRTHSHCETFKIIFLLT